MAGPVTRHGDLTVEFGEANAGRARAVPAVVAAARIDMKERLGLDLPQALTIRFLGLPEAFLGWSGGRPVELYAGRAYPASGTIHIAARALDVSPHASALPRLLRHELVHIAVGRRLGERRLPKWFEEGLACAFSWPLGTRDLGRVGDAPPLSRLTGSFPEEGELLGLAYAKSEAAVRLILRGGGGRGGWRAAGAIIDRFARGEDFEAALKAVTGLSTAGLDGALLRSLRRGPLLRALELMFAPRWLFLWAALLCVVGAILIRRRRRAQLGKLDEFP